MKRDSKSRGKASASQAKGPAPKAATKSKSGHQFRLPEKKLLEIYDTMVKARTLEERLIRMYKQNDGYFWIGGPGEEAFSVPLGLQVKKGFGHPGLRTVHTKPVSAGESSHVVEAALQAAGSA